MFSTAYDVFDSVRGRTWECLTEETVGHLATFWTASRWTMSRYGLPLSMGSPDFRHFSHWIAARRGDGLHTGGWQYFLAKDEPGKEGIESFFRELDSFRGLRLRRVALARLVEPRAWPTHVVKAGLHVAGGEMVVPSAADVVQVELRAYLPEEAYFLVAIRADGRETERWCWTRTRAEELARIELGVEPGAWEEVLDVV